MSEAATSSRSDAASLVRHGLFSLAAIFTTTGGLVWWASTAEIAGAVVANGTLVVESHARLVQHQDGGTIASILVQDDQAVSADQVLITLADTQIRATLDAATERYNEAVVEQARLKAEIGGRTAFDAPPALGGPRVTELIATQQQLLTSQLADRDGQVAQLNEQIAQLNHQTDGLSMQQQAVVTQLDILKTRAAAVDSLVAKQLAQADDSSALHLQEAAAQGENGRLTAAIAQTRATIAEKTLAVQQVEAAFTSARLDDLNKARLAAADALQQRRTAEEQLDRTVLRAPVSGVVHQLVAHTVGGVVAPGETIMEIVPQADRLMVAIRISPDDIDQVEVGQSVSLRFTGFERRRMPEGTGEVEQVSPDLVADQQTGHSYFTANVRLDAASMAQWPADVHLVPGMPVETFLTTGNRTVLDYLIHPFVEELQLAFREQ